MRLGGIDENLYVPEWGLVIDRSVVQASAAANLLSLIFLVC